jgi:hypothetical protein
VSTRCPKCLAALVEGSLRCRFCDADARAAEKTPGVAVTFSLEDAARDADRVQALAAEFEELAPEVFAWWRTAPREKKTRVYEILTEIRAFWRERLGRKG